MQPTASSGIIGQLHELGPFADGNPKLPLGKREAVGDALPRGALQTLRSRAKSRARLRSVCK